MAIAAGTIWEINSAATAGNLNGGGFNIGNANFLTNYTATSATGDAPVISSASYTFVAGDVGAWLYVKAGTSWTVGFYQITAVNGGAATVNAAIGAAVQQNATTLIWGTNTVAGVATVASPTGGTIGIDYSRGNAAIINDVDLASADGDNNPTSVTSAAKPFGANHVGNILHITAGASWTAGWYEIVSVSGVTAVLDRAASGTNGAITDGTFYVGGAISLGTASDNTFFAVPVAGNHLFLKAGTIVIGQALTAGTAGTATAPVRMIGYNSLRYDNPRVAANRPLLNPSGLATAFASYWELHNINMTTTSAAGLNLGTFQRIVNCKMVNNSTTASRAAITSNTSCSILDCELISYRGSAVTTNNSSLIQGCYIHSSNKGILFSGTTVPFMIIDCVIENCVAHAIEYSGAATLINTIQGCTLAGTVAKRGVGIGLAAGVTATRIINNLMYGFVTGLSYTDTTSTSLHVINNMYHNNTTNSNNTVIATGVGATLADPAFAAFTEINRTDGTTSGSVLTSAGADFSSVTPGEDYCYIASGTGVTAGFYGITNKTATTLTLDIAPGDSAVADKVISVITGHNFRVGTNARGVGFPSSYPTAQTMSGLDAGAVQRIEDYPAVTNVRLNTAYSNSELTGTLNLPSNTDVRLNVTYDNGNQTGALLASGGKRLGRGRMGS